MNITDYPQLLQVLESDQKIVYLCGAGVSMALGKHRTSWGAWLQNGTSYLSDAEKSEFDRIIGAWTADSMIDAAGYLLDTLKRQGTYHDYMRSSFSGLTVKQETMANGFSQIHRAGDFISTTNYDLLLEQAAATGTVTYADAGKILQMLRGEASRQIIHLHGAYDPAHGIDDIIADNQQYQGIVNNPGAQFIQNLIGTHPMIILGCGATVEDPNLSGFLTFVAKHLRLDVPYFYVHRDGDDLSHLPGNMIPICYGSDYDDLPIFLGELAAYRLRHRRVLKALTSVFPYARTNRLSSAFGRLHFTNEFSAFVGRRDELKCLDHFCAASDQISWWAVTGEGGMGKSRLLLQWLRNLPSSWYGFFANPNAPAERYLDLKPFTNTVIVLDYILGRETQCAAIIQNLMQVFEATQYRLRIILLERRYDPAAENWLKRMMDSMDAVTRLAFQSHLYAAGTNAGALMPMQIGAMNDDDERAYIAEYLRSYLPAFTDASTTQEYLNHLDQRCGEIQAGFRQSLEPNHRRPLFLSVYTELWVYYSGDVPVTGAEELLEAYLEKEEQRWFLRFGGDRAVLYAYQKLLGMACAVEMICVNEDADYLQPEADCLTAFLQRERRAGKKKPAWDDLFIWQEVEDKSGKSAREIIQSILEDEETSEDMRYVYAWSMMKIVPEPDHSPRPPRKYLILGPAYPDIIRAFIADYYLDEEDTIPFTKFARSISTFEFSAFLTRALEDFPEKSNFREMLLIPPEDTNDNLEFYTSLLDSDIWFDRHKEIEQILLRSDRSREYHFAEVELWRRILIVLAEQNQLEALYDAAAHFFEYFKHRLDIPQIVDEFPELLDACIIPFHNDKQTDRMEEILKLADGIADASQDEYVADACAEGYLHLLRLRTMFEQGRGAGRCWDKIKFYVEHFPDDESLADCLAEAGTEWGPDLMQKKLPKRYRRMAEAVEYAHAKHPTASIAGDLAAILANEYFLSYKLKREYAEADQIMQHCTTMLEQLHHRFPEEQPVVRAYSCIRSDQHFDRCMFSGICVDEAQPYQTWHEKYPDDLEIAESYAKMLYVRHQYLLQQGNRKEARRCVQKLTALANQFPFQEDDEGEQWIHSVLSLIQASN